MFLTRRYAGWFIWTSLALAVLLTTTPLFSWSSPLHPAWAPLVLMFWCIVVPERVGVATGWVMGLALDVTGGGLLGENALALTLVAYIARRLSPQLRVFPMVQQMLVILLLVGLYQLLLYWVEGAIGQAPASPAYWLSSLTSALIWPLVYLVLNDLGQRLRLG